MKTLTETLSGEKALQVNSPGEHILEIFMYEPRSGPRFMHQARPRAQICDLPRPPEFLWLRYTSDLFAVCISTALNNEQHVFYYRSRSQ